jgi:hypothetical protein
MAKRWTRDQATGGLWAQDDDRGFPFGITSHAVRSVRDLARVADAAAGDPHPCIIRGEPADATQAGATRRTRAASLDRPRRSLHDIASLECPPAMA